MSVKVGSARIDEVGQVKYGIAGDQTGQEVSTQDWYLNSKGWVIIRAKDDEVREKIAYAMQRACDNENIGYDQSQRSTAFNWCKKANNYDPGAITTPVEVDCSALVRLCCWYAGVQVQSFTTSNEVSILRATGQFDIISDERTKSSDEQMRGDILVTATKGHTVVVLDDGAAIKKTNEDGSIGVATARGSVKVRTGASTDFPSIGTAKKGQSFKVFEILENGWLKIGWGDGFGYTSNAGNKYYDVAVEKETVAAPAPTPAPTTSKYKVLSPLFVRTGPGKNNGTVAVLARDSIIEVTEEVNGWAKLADGRGYSSLKYLKKL